MTTERHVPPGDDGEGCDCTELCSMGPTCPGAILARLPGAGCWRTTERTGDDLREKLARLLPTTPLADEHCHATITDEDGEEDACGMPAAHWVIYDPETGDQRAWPVCYGHASESYSGSVADEWVEALTGALALLDRAHVADALADTLGEAGC